jgi:hypothetical protein
VGDPGDEAELASDSAPVKSLWGLPETPHARVYRTERA